MTLNPATCLRWLFAPLLATMVLGASDPAPITRPHPLVWDAMEKTLEAKPEDGDALFEFSVTNTSAEPVTIREIEPSCGCTVAELPSTPWILAPGAQGSFTAVVEYRGKHGTLSKTLAVSSAAGNQTLTMVIKIVETEEGRRARNQQLALADRQAVFRGECASCHVLPAINQTGGALFQAACAICHGAETRASMVPDLRVAREPRDAAYWEKWIADGKERTLMPGFAAKHGGPLTSAQIVSLVEYALSTFPTTPAQN